VAEILRAAFLGPDTKNPNRATVLKALIAEAGALPPQKLSAAHVLEVEAIWRKRSPFTRHNYAKALRQVLRWLWEHHGAPKLDGAVPRTTSPRPRNVTVHDDERAALLTAAPPHLRLWLLLCGDLAIRSGTAIRIGPEHFNRQRGTLSFTTKCDEHLTLPVTTAIEALIDKCNPHDSLPYVCQLWREHSRTIKRGGHPSTFRTNTLREQFTQLRKRLGLRRVTLHDHRRTAAVAMLEHSRDVRDVQALLGHKNLTSTFHYLDHQLRPISRHTLELIKRPKAQDEERTA
jgi:integrase